MRRAQNRFGDGQRAGAGLGEKIVDDAQMHRRFTFEDIEQDRIQSRQGAGDDLDRIILELDRCRYRRRCRHVLQGCRNTARDPLLDHALDHRRRRCAARYSGQFALCQAIGGVHDGLDINVGRTFATQGGKLSGQGIDGMFDQGHGLRAGTDRAVEHAIEHALDLPAEFAKGECADKSTRTLQGVERATDRFDLFEIIRLRTPLRKLRAQVVDFLLHFFDEDITDLVIDLVGGGNLEAAIGGSSCGNLLLDFFLDLLFDLDPAAAIGVDDDADIRLRGTRIAGRDFRVAIMDCLGKAHAGDILLGRQVVDSLADDQAAQIIAFGHFHDAVEFGWLLDGYRIFGRREFAFGGNCEIKPVEVDFARFHCRRGAHGRTLPQG